MKEPHVEVAMFDTTLRDGAQSLPRDHQFKQGSKAQIAKQVAKLGIGVIEAGFPATPSDGREVHEVAEQVGTRAVSARQYQGGHEVGRLSEPPVVAGFARALESDIERAWQAVAPAQRPRINTFVSTSDFHRTHKFPGVSRDKLLIIGADAVHYAKKISSTHPGASVEFSAEAASTTDMGYLKEVVIAVLEAGVDVVNVPDTVGERDPFWMRDYYAQIIDWVMKRNPQATIAAHNHNDLGLAATNTLALIFAAADYVATHKVTVRVQLETTICGLGERAGNADVFAVVGGLFKFAPTLPAPIMWRFNPEYSVEVARTVMAQACYDVPRQSVVVGSDTNVHRSGIHSDGVVKGGHAMYTPFDPTFWGHEQQAVHEDGKYQGKAGRAALSSV